MRTEETCRPEEQLAFPLVYDWTDDESKPQRQVYLGMTLRDYFAGKVLNGVFGNDLELPQGTDADGIAQTCYMMADAMLSARDKAQKKAVRE